MLGDVIVGIPCGLLGLRQGLSERDRRRTRSPRAPIGKPAAPAASPAPPPALAPAVRRAPRPTRRAPAPPPPVTHLVFALVLGLVGLLRYGSDIVSDVNPGWWESLDGTPFRYLVRAPSDGSLAGTLNVQFFKVLAIPAGIAWLYVFHRLAASDRRQAQRTWQSTSTRAIYLGCLMLAVTIMEVEKATHIFGLTMAGLLPGEKAWVNHLLHVGSAGLGFLLMRWLRLTGPEEPSTPTSAPGSAG